jgi:hypothetical protein
MHTTTKKIKSMIILLLVFSFVLAFSKGFTAKAEAKTLIVPDDYLTITDAIGNATENDTIYVKSGTYECPENETLVINKTLSIMGEDPKSTIINIHPPLVLKNIFTFTYWGYSTPLKIEANDVKLVGLTIDTPACDSISITGERTKIIGNNVTTGIVGNGNEIQIKDNTILGGISVKGFNQIIFQNTIIGGIVIGGNYTRIEGNNISKSDPLIDIVSSFNIVCGNTVTSSGGASCIKIELGVTSNIIAKNIIIGSGNGIHVQWGDNSTFFANRVIGCGYGINVDRGSNNLFYANYVANNQIGARMGIDQSSISRQGGPNAFQNILYHNNFVDNDVHAIDWNWLGTNYWDNGKEGNYWSDYKGTDNNEDGIGDVSYALNETVSFYGSITQSTDLYPLMAPITVFDAGMWEWTRYNVDVISNSTVSDFVCHPDLEASIKFSVEGETGTTGFCRVTIPKDLLNTEGDWTVLVDGASVTPTVNVEANNTYLYFTYQHSTKTVEIIGTDAIPEFPSWIILPLFLMTVLFAVALKKRIRYLSAT